MKILLDTCAFLWIITDADELSQTARELFVEPENDIYLSVISVWEILIKYQLGKLHLPEPPEHYIPLQRSNHGIESLSLDEESALQLKRLPELHKDPFDRMLICQAIVHGLTLLTSDRLINQYPIRTRW